MRQQASAAVRGTLSAARRLWACALFFVVGCQLPPARHAACDPLPFTPPRAVPLVRQLACDSAFHTARYPLRSGWELLYETADQLWSNTQGEFGKRVLLPLCGEPPPLRGCPDELLPLLLDARLSAADVRLYPGGPEALAALEAVIAQATCRIDVLMFEWEDDEVGAAIARWLTARAGPHFRVRVLVDGGGNLIFGRPFGAGAAQVNRAVTTLARNSYVEVVRTRNPYARFDHRKLVLADGVIAWSGGRNLVARAFREQHDLSFTVAGPLAGDLAEIFERFWREQGGRSQQSGVRGQQPAYLANAEACLVRTAPTDHQLQRALYDAVDHARAYLLLENVYFCDSHLVYKLAQARRRGVDVRVVLTVTSTNGPINASNRVIANRLYRAGVRVYLYPGMTHVKAAAADGHWAYLGTGNFDALSLRHNHEIGLTVGSGPVIQELEERLFVPDCNPAWEMKGPLPLCATDYLCELLAGWWL